MNHYRGLSRRAVVAGVAALMALGQPAFAQADYPNRPITAVVPYGTGGGADIFARLVAPYLGEALGQPVVIENKPGAGSNLGMQFVAKAAPDGYTILINGMGNVFNPAVFRNMGFDPVEDLVPVAQIAEYSVAITVGAHVPANTLQEFVDLLKSKPGEFNGASGGVPNMLALELFKAQTGVDFVTVNYNGSGEGTNAIVKGEADFIITDGTSSRGGVADGTLKNLATANAVRSSSFPDVPTTAEAGFPDYVVPGIYGLYVPKGTPPEVIAKLNAAIATAVDRPDIKERFETMGLTFQARSSEEFATYIRGEIAKWQKLARDADIPYLD